jgi:hypothetical protein
MLSIFIEVSSAGADASNPALRLTCVKLLDDKWVWRAPLEERHESDASLDFDATATRPRTRRTMQ